MTFKKAVATRKKAPFFKTNIYVDHHSQHTSTFCPTSLCSTWADFVIEENSSQMSQLKLNNIRLINKQTSLQQMILVLEYQDIHSFKHQLYPKLQVQG